jgi:hypothetical protein
LCKNFPSPAALSGRHSGTVLAGIHAVQIRTVFVA